MPSSAQRLCLLLAVLRLVPDPVLAFGARLSLWERALATLVMGEFGFYWGHGWSHEIPFLWRFHAIHHGAKTVDWLTNQRGHPVDIVLTRLCGLMPIFVLGLARPDAGGGIAALPMVLATFWGYFVHANLRWRFGWLEAVVATPRLPSLASHQRPLPRPQLRLHASHLRSVVRNAAPAQRRHPPLFGIDAQLPDNFVGQLVAPLDPAARR